MYRQKTWKTRVLSSETLHGQVVAVYISRPKNFRYKSGMYVFLNFPFVSKYEWHPYTLTSSPGDKFLNVHIANLGDWSGAVNRHFSYQNTLECSTLRKSIREPSSASACSRTAFLSHSMKSMSIEVGSRGGSDSSLGAPSHFSALSVKSTELEKVFVDGPYGAPAQDHEQYRVLLLIGAGIGVTPFASILRNLLTQFEEHRCMHCGKVVVAGILPDILRSCGYL